MWRLCLLWFLVYVGCCSVYSDWTKRTNTDKSDKCNGDSPRNVEAFILRRRLNKCIRSHLNQVWDIIFLLAVKFHKKRRTQSQRLAACSWCVHKRWGSITDQIRRIMTLYKWKENLQFRDEQTAQWWILFVAVWQQHEQRRIPLLTDRWN